MRTGLLLQYLGNAELRSMIQAATNKSESFDDFVKWLAFGGGGVIAENDRAERRKVIKYNHQISGLMPRRTRRSWQTVGAGGQGDSGISPSSA